MAGIDWGGLTVRGSRHTFHRTMVKWLASLAVGILLAGCNPFDRGGEPAGPEMFDPAAMRIHPVFTQVKDWTGDGQPDGIEALVELTDQFGDPTKGSGKV